MSNKTKADIVINNLDLEIFITEYIDYNDSRNLCGYKTHGNDGEKDEREKVKAIVFMRVLVMVVELIIE